MLKPEKLEMIYTKYMSDLSKWLQDGIIEINLEFLNNFDLLHRTDEEEQDIQKQFPFYFHVVETKEKVTLFNNQFIVWIVPKVIDEVPTTITLISLVNEDTPHLELAFSTSGTYNNPKYVLKVLRYFLTEVIDTEEEIAAMTRGKEGL